MNVRLLSAALIVAASTSVFAQQEGTTRAFKVGGSDPFAVSKGSSFEASRPGAKKDAVSANAPLTSSISNDVREALRIISSNHVSGKQLDVESVTKSSINSMLKTLDPHSNFYDAAEFTELLGDQNSEYYGTGSTIVSHERGGRIETFVLSVFPGSPSERVGLRYGDRILAVDGRSVESFSSRDIRDMIRGPRSTSVRVTIERDGAPLTVDLKRDRVPQPTVTAAFIVEDGVGLIEMSEGFSLTSAAEFNTALDGLKKAGITSLILDLRGNPGGVLEQSIKIAERFLPSGTRIVSQRGRFPYDDRVWRSGNKAPERMPLVVLVDGDSASASEVIAGALQDNDRALIVGEKTFGKGLVQSVLDIPSGRGLTLTTARYYTPSGRSIQRDYVRSGTYDYYNHRETTEDGQEAKVAAYTVTKRLVYGGDGITPDEFVPAVEVNRTRISMLDPVFFFVRQQAAQGMTEGDIQAFAAFAEEQFGISQKVVMAEAEFVRTRLAYNFALARRGMTPAKETMLRNDPQVAASIRSLPRAAAFSRTPGSKTYSAKD